MKNGSGVIAVFRAGDIALIVGASCVVASLAFAEDEGPMVFDPSLFKPGLTIVRIGWQGWDGEFDGSEWIVSNRRPHVEERHEFIRTGAVTVREIVE